MAQPTLEQVHADRPLTNISVAYIQDAEMFKAARMFPVLPSDRKSNSYYIYTKDDWFRDEAQILPPGAETAGSGYNLSTTTFKCDVWGIHKDVDDQEVYNSDEGLEPLEDATAFVTERMLLRQEKQWVTDAFATSIWGTDATPANLWSNYATSTPIVDFETAKRTILLNTGKMANTVGMGYDVYIQLINHPDIIDRLNQSADRIANEQKLAAIFGIPNVHVFTAINNTAVENETAVYAFTHGKHALVGYVEPNPGKRKASMGYTFAWTGVSTGLGENVGVKRFHMPWIHSERVESVMAFDNKIVATDLGYFFNSAVS